MALRASFKTAKAATVAISMKRKQPEITGAL